MNLLLAAIIAVGGVAAPAASAGCASYPGATVVKCVQDTPKPKKVAKKRDRRVARVNLDVDHPVRESDLPKRTKR